MSKLSLPVPVIVSAMNDFAIGSRERADMSFFAPSLTRQEFAEECDINTLMERYEKSGVISHVNRAQPIYMDMTDLPDLREGLDIMREATTAFMALPAKVRREFDHDPVKFVEFAGNKDNLERMREWGLAAPVAAAPEPILVKVMAPPDPPPAVPGPKGSPGP